MGLEAGLALSVCGHRLSCLHPFPACWQLSCSCHYTQGLQVFQSSAVSLSNSIFLPDKRGAGSAFPFTATGWMSAAVASVLVRKIKKEVKEATALKLQAGERIWAWPLLGRPVVSHSRCRGGGWGWGWGGEAGLARVRLGPSPAVSFPKREQCGLWSPLTSGLNPSS